MKELVDSFWRAAAYCLHPKVILLSLLPLLFSVAAVLGLGWFYWERARWPPCVPGWSSGRWSSAFCSGSSRSAPPASTPYSAPLIVVALAVPLIVVASLLLVAWLMTPSLVNLVAVRRFETLERKRGAGWFSASAVVPSATCCCAGFCWCLSLPLWFIPPLVLVLPPLIWGWMTNKVMAYDVLAEHASADERRALLREHRWPLLAMGLVTGYLGAAPSLVWAFSALTLVSRRCWWPCRCGCTRWCSLFGAVVRALRARCAAARAARAGRRVGAVPARRRPTPSGPPALPHARATRVRGALAPGQPCHRPKVP